MSPKGDDECVKVVVRCRPMNEKEIQEGRQRIVDMDLELGQVSLRNPKLDTREPPKAFTFDQVYDWDSKQIDIFNISAKPIVDSVISGYNGTMFAYGQTGTGKSFTMDGGPGELQGIIPNAFKHIFSHIDASDNTQFLVRASYLEIYNEEIRDLLSRNPKNKLDLKENVDTGVYVKGLNSFVVKSVPEIQNVMDVGKKNRSVGATLMNQDSSRSHSIFCITIETSEITGTSGRGSSTSSISRVASGSPRPARPATASRRRPRSTSPSRPSATSSAPSSTAKAGTSRTGTPSSRGSSRTPSAATPRR
uniref:Kinesin-like protein kif3b n=1 Tax=Tetraselmis sp. GSL018 TaxID=582737 RepID=A0A061QII0_9CHLO